MKTKPFLLATAGSTVDGRVIDEKMLQEMASSYDPKTYAARLNIEHIRGISGQAPFRAYGDVLELSTQEVEVNFNGTTEKRLGLYGVLDVTEEAKQLNAAGQKVYPSIEIEPNFGGKGFAYLMGAALTDSPASIATERLAFNRQLPGVINLSRGDEGQGKDPTALEFAEAADDTAGKSFLTSLEGVLGKFFKQEPATPPAKVEDLKPLFTDLAQAFATSIEGLRTEFRGEADAQALRLKALETKVEGTPDTKHTQRPQAAGANGKYAVTDC
ncbi:GPO family capsid scaffolding protein [Alteraurantiacibacter buctensis]|uniref:GPO family capsid scaffolding protein n=1 Tax=Alteraurantiacibacter buctensis TaxID=1503981 RepID=A0A844Z1A8_9SPHN|nr:GPO family capsid scaffolding protein [Alteraurantiacibacter buctensis]MXO73579.1 hypothetical protein [Alteraurantiacibacter buctensis]